jgi:hypothetical protein
MRTCNVVVIAVVAFLAPFVARAPVKAGLVEVVVSGVVSDTDLWYSLLPDATGPVVGDPVEFRNIVNLDEINPVSDDFRQYSMEEFTFSVGGDEFSRSAPAGTISVANRDIGDLYKAFTKIDSDNPFLGFDFFSVKLLLIDSTATALNGLDQPESLDLANYDLIEFTAGGASGFRFPEDDPLVFWITPTEISVRVVPEPASLVLLILCAPMLSRCGCRSGIQ